jgi:hypothetical protein
VFARHDVGGVGRHEILGEIGGNVADAGRNRRRNSRVRQISVDQRLKVRDEPVDPLRRQVEAEDLDGDELVFLRAVGTKNGSERACSNLMKNTKWTERLRVSSAASFRLQ